MNKKTRKNMQKDLKMKMNINLNLLIVKTINYKKTVM